MSLVKKGIVGIAAVAALTTMSAAPALAQTIAISWSAFQEERWAKDREAFLSVFEPAGFEIVESDAQNSPERQNADIENLITQQPDFLIVISTDTVQVVSPHDARACGSSAREAEKIPRDAPVPQSSFMSSGGANASRFMPIG